MDESEVARFEAEVAAQIDGLAQDTDVQALSRIWVREIARHKYAYNFAWLGRPAIQFPTDAWALQELVWKCRPDLIIETGIAHGGSLVFSASMLALLDLCDAAEAGTTVDPRAPRRQVLGIDIEIRPHNRRLIEAHPMASRIQMIEGSSIDGAIVEQVHAVARNYARVLVCLDSNHTHEHVFAELQAYASLTTVGSYCIVFDTLLEEMPAELSAGRPWGPGNGPKSAVLEFLKQHSEFEIDRRIDHKLLISVAPSGYLRRVR